MKFIKQFATLAQFNNFTLDSTNTPNVSLIQDNYGLQYTQYIPEVHNYALDYLTVVALENLEIYFGWNDYDPEPIDGVSYSLDNGQTWSNEDRSVDVNNKIILSAGDKMLLKSYTMNNNVMTFGQSSRNETLIQSSGNYSIEGNIMSLVDGDNFVENETDIDKFSDYHFAGFFDGDTHLISAENLILPSVVKFGMYMYTFSGCTSLITAPVLPATTLEDFCYMGMFSGCTSLNYIKILSTDSGEDKAAFGGWIGNYDNITVSPTGTFVKPANLTLPIGVDGIPSGWTVQNI